MRENLKGYIKNSPTNKNNKGGKNMKYPAGLYRNIEMLKRMTRLVSERDLSIWKLLKILGTS